MTLLGGCDAGDTDTSATTSSAPTMRTIAYGEQHPAQVADLYLPDRADETGRGKSIPVVVLLHGGFWLARYERDLMAPVAEDLVARGYAVWNVEYRRPDAGSGWADTFVDAAGAVDHLARLAADHDLDLERVAVIGHSAGGTLAAWLATRSDLPVGEPGVDPEVTIRAVVCQAGVLDLTAAAHNDLGGGAVQRLLDGGPDRRPRRYQLASPLSRLPTAVPTLLVHGEADRLVPISQSRSYAQAAGPDQPVKLVELPAVAHFAHLDPTSAAWQAVVEHLPQLLGSPGGTSASVP